MAITKTTQNLCELFEKGESGVALGCQLIQVQDEQGYSDNEINLLADLVLAGNDLDMCIAMIDIGVEDLDVLY